MWEFLDDFCGQPLWDSAVSWNTTNPELSPCLERTLLVWAPCALLWALCPLELQLQRGPASIKRTLPWTGTNIARMVVATTLAVLCMAGILDTTFNRRTDPMFSVDVTADSLKMGTFILSVILMALNRRSGRHTSGVLFIFWFCLTACEIFTYRSAFLRIKRQSAVGDESVFVLEMIYFPLLVSELVLCCIADRRRPGRTTPSPGERKECPEQSASFLSKLIFWWFNGMAILGWRKPLTMGDLWQLNPEDRTKEIAARFNRYWRGSDRHPRIDKSISRDFAYYANGTQSKAQEEEVEFKSDARTPSQKQRVYIVRILCKAFWPYFTLGSISKGVYDCLQFVNPLVLKLLIDFVQSSEPRWQGMLFAFLMFGNGCLQSVLLGNYFQRMFVLGMRVRTALVSAIYQKSLVLSPASRRESTVGEIVNLMSVDSQRFMDLMTYLNLLWSAPLQIILAVALLWRLLGASVLAGLLVMTVLIPFNALLASRCKRLQVKQMKSKDERVKLINEILSGIKVLKLYAWEEAFQEQVYRIRDGEVRQLRGIAYINSVSILLWNCSPFMVSLASFACYVLVDDKHVLDATTAFVSLALFNILRFPLTMLPHMITALVMVSVSVKRINKFLNSEELEVYVTRGAGDPELPIEVRGGHFAWSRDETSRSLKGIDLTVQKGSLIAIVGQVGSGKSSLLSAILGDMEKLRGSVFINGSTALVSQQAWIQNASLRDNILFSRPLDEEAYRAVVDACGLQPDLAVLPGGDRTEIGEKGINLSGGQKQRVSLARAAYSGSDILLLDDPLSAVDSHVGRHIFDRLIGPNGLLKDKTRILVTHGLTYLPQTDAVLVMADGCIAERGTFQQLVDSKGPFAEFLTQYLQGVDTTEEDLEVLEDIGQKNPELLRSLSERSGESEQDSKELSHRRSILSVNRSPSIKRSPSRSDSIADPKQLIQSETAETGEVLWSVYTDYLRAVGLGWVAVILVSYLAWQLFAVGSSVWLSEWGNDKPGPNGTQNLSTRDLRLGVYGALGLGQGLSIFVGSFAVAYGTLLAANSLHRGLLANVLRAPMGFFDTTPLGRVVNRFAKDVDTVDVTIPMTLRSWLSCLLQVLSTLGVISLQTPLFLTVILPIGVVYYIIQRFYVSTSRQLKRLESVTRSPVYSHFSETLAGCSTIRAYEAQERFCEHSSALVDANQRCYYPSIVANRWLAIRLDFCGNCIILFSAVFAVLGREDLDPGKVGLSVSYALMVTATLNWLVRMSSELETNIVAVERILEYTHTPTEAPWVAEGLSVAEEWPHEGRVQLDNYSTRYREGLDLVLKGITCDIAPGEKVGIVGRTGAGKSSLTLALFRLIEGAGGSITMDGIPIATLGLHQLRSKVTIIPQDPVLFSGTLRHNLDPFSWYSDVQLWEALEHAHLKVFVASLDKGLSHEVVEGGENLSVGQRQLVCLARAVLRRTRILVLDEATAAVDLETDRLLQTSIRREFAQSTVLTIAHRLHTVLDYDRIMVLDNGRIVEFDSPDKLLKDKDSIFYGMAKDAGLV